jgi:hypothetical protein
LFAFRLTVAWHGGTSEFFGYDLRQLAIRRLSEIQTPPLTHSLAYPVGNGLPIILPLEIS